MTELIIIAAISENNVIGKNGKIPWHYKEDMKHFRELTLGNPIIMGRKTYESIGKPLDERINIILTRTPYFKRDGMVTCNSLDEALDFCSKHDKAFIIGGQNVYEQTIDLVDRLELTLIHKEVEGNEFFPKINFHNWYLTQRIDKEEYSFATYYRRTKKE